MFKSNHQLFFTFTLFITSTVFIGCNLFNKKEPLTESVGKAGNLVITSDNKTLAILKSDFDSAFLTPLVSLPSVIPFYELNTPDLETFSKFFYNQRNVLVVVLPENMKQMDELLETFSSDSIELWTKSTELTIRVRENILAKHQHLTFLFCNSSQNLKLQLVSQRERIVNILLQAELKDEYVKLYGEDGMTSPYYKSFKEKYGVGVNIPKGFYVVKENDNFYWFQKDTTIDGLAKSIGLIVHAYPSIDSSDFTYLKMRSMRDSFCKYNIAGSLKGTYMTTSESSFYPARTFELTTVNNLMAGKMRGWWTIKGMTMAGPFIRYVVQVPDKSSLFVFEGFIYQADLNTKERDLRIIEAIATTIK